MKKYYEKPEIEAIELEVEDIIQTSGLHDGTILNGLVNEENTEKTDNGAQIGTGGVTGWL